MDRIDHAEAILRHTDAILRESMNRGQREAAEDAISELDRACVRYLKTYAPEVYERIYQDWETRPRVEG